MTNAFPAAEDDTTLAMPAASSVSEHWRLICVSASEPRWAALALQIAEADIPNPRIEWVDSAALLMTRLREDRCDAVLVEHDQPIGRGPCLDRGVHAGLATPIETLPLIQALRGGGHRDAVVVLLAAPDDRLLAELARCDAEPLVSLAPWDSPALLPTIQRAMRLAELKTSHHELEVKHQRRMRRECEEAGQMLRQQQDLLSALIQPPEFAAAEDSVAALRGDYQELLRTYVLSESGRIGDEIRQFAEALVRADFTPQQVMMLHLDCVRTLVEALGRRSSIHVLNRADLLALDLMLNLAEGYRQRSLPRMAIAA